VILVAHLVTNRFITRALFNVAGRTEFTYDDVIVRRIKPRRLALMAPLLLIGYFANLIPNAEELIRTVVFFLVLWLGVATFGAFLDAINDIYESRPNFTGATIKGYVDVVKILAISVGVILSISLLTGQSAMTLLTGLGAVTTILMLIFRDTILALIASFQISANDLVREGDWLEVPAYGADGDVVDMSLHQIKIQNFALTISIVPTHKMLETGYKNWRGMSESGGRRIMRALLIDQSSVRICDDAMIEQLRQINLIRDYIDKRRCEVEGWNDELSVNGNLPVNGRRLTNLGTFRAYIVEYLRSHPKIRKDMTVLVRQLAPGPTGLPLEIYAFTDTTDWIAYEAIQADIFDHLLAVVPEFGLRVFQELTGSDFQGSYPLPASSGAYPSAS
jgi:miniconductance mechanosensitive channel